MLIVLIVTLLIVGGSFWVLKRKKTDKKMSEIDKNITIEKDYDSD